MIQITISEKYNPKVAGWLMDNNIEYSSVPVQEGKSKEVAAIDEFPIYPIFADVLENITWEGFINNLRLAFIDGAEWQHKTQSPVPVSVGYSLDDMEKMLGPVVHPTEQQDKGDGLD